MSDASKTTPANPGPAAGSTTEAEAGGKATPPRFTIPRKSKAVADTPSPNVNVNEDRASRDRGEYGVGQPARSGQLVPAQLDQIMMTQAVAGDAAAVTQSFGPAATIPQNQSYGPADPLGFYNQGTGMWQQLGDPTPMQLGPHAHAGTMRPATLSHVP